MCSQGSFHELDGERMFERPSQRLTHQVYIADLNKLLA
jgi:hypothetical protein